jgi:PTH1 family peptidyl-tRNA hydrolase
MPGVRMVVGLGNPGDEYENTRHNAGFWFAQALARAQGGSLRLEKGFQARMAKVDVAGLPVWICEPQTYMNRSGISVAGLANFYKITPDEILVVHDELDFLPGTVKLKLGGSSGGHNGLKDITARIGTQDFWRMRIGIGHPRSFGFAQDVADFVLHKPSREHLAAIETCIEAGIAVLPELVQGRPEQAMKNLHTR